MGSIFARGRKLYAKIQDVDGEWRQVATGFSVDERAEADRWVKKREREVADAKGGFAVPAALTLTAYADRWIDMRIALGVDWKKDRGHLDNYILPVLGDQLVADTRTRHLVELITRIRTSPMPDHDGPPSQRTVYNIYSTACALFRDAKIADIIEQSPCCLTSRQLGPKVDKDPEWRASAVFDRGEVEIVISTPSIPQDRRVAYALELLGGLRPGESSAVRWRHYDAQKAPLGELTVSKAHSSKRDLTKGTKTEVVRHVPVHPTLAAMLAEWKLEGWARVMGRRPTPDDLIVPMPPADADARTHRAASEPHRTDYYSRRRWYDDVAELGWRHRRHYDMRATFITLALDDGADPHIIETRVTHTKRTRSAFGGYNRGKQWAIVCAEVSKLRIARQPALAMAVGAALVQSAKTAAMTSTSELRRRGSNGPSLPSGDVSCESNRVDSSGDTAADGTDDQKLHHGLVQSCCDLGLAVLRARR